MSKVADEHGTREPSETLFLWPTLMHAEEDNAPDLHAELDGELKRTIAEGLQSRRGGIHRAFVVLTGGIWTSSGVGLRPRRTVSWI